jgi:daunorubicin resistance ABC transporter ATP-binding subunit
MRQITPAEGMTALPGDGPAPRPLRPAAGQGAAIAAEGLVKRFGEVEALKGVDLTVPYGQVVGLLGPNGSGKTTTSRILTTLLTPDAGRVLIDGIDAVASPERVRPLIGMAGQYAAVDPNLTGRENLLMVGRLTGLTRALARRRAAELLEQFRLADIADRPSRSYSGGQRRRFDLAAALVHSPRILFFDEPTTGLDPRSRRDLWSVLEQLVADGTTILLTTQYLEEADHLADHLVVLDQGSVIAQGTPAQLKAGLGVSVIAARFAGEDEAEAAAQVLSGRYRAVRRGDRVEAPAGAAALDILGALQHAGLSPLTFAVREPSLDDVFLALTGRAAHQPQADSREAA